MILPKVSFKWVTKEGDLVLYVNGEHFGLVCPPGHHNNRTYYLLCWDWGQKTNLAQTKEQARRMLQQIAIATIGAEEYLEGALDQLGYDG